MRIVTPASREDENISFKFCDASDPREALRVLGSRTADLIIVRHPLFGEKVSGKFFASQDIDCPFSKIFRLTVPAISSERALVVTTTYEDWEKEFALKKLNPIGCRVQQFEELKDLKMENPRTGEKRYSDSHIFVVPEYRPSLSLESKAEPKNKGEECGKFGLFKTAVTLGATTAAVSAFFYFTNFSNVTHELTGLNSHP